MWLFVPAGVLRLQDVQQQLLDVAGGQLVDVLGGHVSCPDLQFMFHGLDDPPGDEQHTHALYLGGDQTSATGSLSSVSEFNRDMNEASTCLTTSWKESRQRYMDVNM